jgi:hypothetical protein
MLSFIQTFTFPKGHCLVTRQLKKALFSCFCVHFIHVQGKFIFLGSACFVMKACRKTYYFPPLRPHVMVVTVELIIFQSLPSCHTADKRTVYFSAIVFLSKWRQKNISFFSLYPFFTYVLWRQENFILQSLSSCRHSDRKKS